MNVFLQFANEMTSKKILPCTACRYCIAHCPMGINIPYLIELYNEHNYSGGGFIAPMAMGATQQENNLRHVSDAKVVNRFVRNRLRYLK